MLLRASLAESSWVLVAEMVVVVLQVIIIITVLASISHSGVDANGGANSLIPYHSFDYVIKGC